MRPNSDLAPEVEIVIGYIEDMCEYWRSGDASSSFKDLEEELGSVPLRGVAIHFLGWLRRLARFPNFPSPRPLKINGDYSWCRGLLKVMRHLGGFEALFDIRDGRLDFRVGVEDSARDCILSIVEKSYNPRVIT